MHYYINYAYNLLHSAYMFRRYYLAIFRQLTPNFILLSEHKPRFVTEKLL